MTVIARFSLLGAVAALLPVQILSAQSANFASPEAPRTTAEFGEDLMPHVKKSRADLFKATAFDATIYGMSPYIHYELMYRQAFDKTAGNYTGYNRFFHEPELAGPDHSTWAVPNSDTLYSTAWIDLSKGPVEIDIPATSLKYFTLNIFDIFGNPSNLSNRTIGFEGAASCSCPRTGMAPRHWA